MPSSSESSVMIKSSRAGRGLVSGFDFTMSMVPCADIDSRRASENFLRKSGCCHVHLRMGFGLLVRLHY